VKCSIWVGQNARADAADTQADDDEEEQTSAAALVVGPIVGREKHFDDVHFDAVP
jgi:hypothetical protein